MEVSCKLCRAICHRLIAILNFPAYPFSHSNEKNVTFFTATVTNFDAISPNLAQIILTKFRRPQRAIFLNFCLDRVRRHFEFFFLYFSIVTKRTFIQFFDTRCDNCTKLCTNELWPKMRRLTD